MKYPIKAFFNFIKFREGLKVLELKIFEGILKSGCCFRTSELQSHNKHFITSCSLRLDTQLLLTNCFNLLPMSLELLFLSSV
jgi:hypothetical protein